MPGCSHCVETHFGVTDDEEEENHLQPILIFKKLFLQFCVVVQVVFIHVILAKFGYIQNRKF